MVNHLMTGREPDGIGFFYFHMENDDTLYARALARLDDVWSGSTDARSVALREASLGLLKVGLAESTGGLSGRPFSARSLFREALAHFEDARAALDHPVLIAGEASALAGQGEFARASVLAEQAWGLDPEIVPYALMRAEYLERQGRFREALDAPVADAVMGASIMPLAFDINDDSAWDPVAMAATRAWPSFIHDMTRGEGGGGLVRDSGLLPLYRQDGVVSQPQHLRHLLTQCPIVGQARRLVVTGNARDALDLLTSSKLDGTLVAEQRRHWQACGDRRPAAAMVGAIAALEAGDRGARDALLAELPGLELSQVRDAHQNLLRYAGVLDRADQAIASWRGELPDDPVAIDRAGEVAFLQGEPAHAAELFAQASAGYSSSPMYARFSNGLDSTDAASALRLAQVRQGVALAETGAFEQAEGPLLQATRPAAAEDCDLCDIIRTQANLQLGTMALSRGDHESAVGYLTDAVGVQFEDEEPSRSFAAPYNNLSLALSLTGDAGAAISAAQEAIERDPANPIFLETLAFAYDKAGELDQAVSVYTNTLEADSSLYTAANNLGILLAQSGRPDEAREVFVQALRANPTYAKGWANLAMLQTEAGSPPAFLQAQGAQARAITHDPSLRGEPMDWRPEEGIYETGIDVVRPLPPDWSFASAARPTVPGFTIAMVLLVLMRVAAALGFDQLVGRVAEQVLGGTPRHRLPWLNRAWNWLLPGWIGVVTIAAIQAAVSLNQPRFSVWEFGALALSTAAVAGGVIATREILWIGGRRHHTWTPLLAFSAVMAPFQIAFAPVPAVPGDLPPWKRWAGPGFLAFALVLFGAVSLITNTPVVRSVAEASSIMLASALLPIKPMDGASLSGKLTNLAVTIALAAIALALTMGWI